MYLQTKDRILSPITWFRISPLRGFVYSEVKCSHRCHRSGRYLPLDVPPTGLPLLWPSLIDSSWERIEHSSGPRDWGSFWWAGAVPPPFDAQTLPPPGPRGFGQGLVLSLSLYGWLGSQLHELFRREACLASAEQTMTNKNERSEKQNQETVYGTAHREAKTRAVSNKKSK